MSAYNNPKIEMTEPSLAGNLYVLDEDLFCNIYLYNFPFFKKKKKKAHRDLEQTCDESGIANTPPHTQYGHVSRCSHQRISSHLNMVHGSFLPTPSTPPPSFPLHSLLESAGIRPSEYPAIWKPQSHSNEYLSRVLTLGQPAQTLLGVNTLMSQLRRKINNAADA